MNPSRILVSLAWLALALLALGCSNEAEPEAPAVLELATSVSTVMADGEPELRVDSVVSHRAGAGAYYTPTGVPVTIRDADGNAIRRNVVFPADAPRPFSRLLEAGGKVTSVTTWDGDHLEDDGTVMTMPPGTYTIEARFEYRGQPEVPPSERLTRVLTVEWLR